jgi:hypothetical protein
VPTVNFEATGNFDTALIEYVDHIGFVVKFAPSAPADLAFNYSLSKPSLPKKISVKKKK